MVNLLLERSGGSPPAPWDISRGLPPHLLKPNSERKVQVLYTAEAGIAYVIASPTMLRVTFRGNPNILFEAQVAQTESSPNKTQGRRARELDSSQPLRIGFSINLKNANGERWNDALHAGVLTDTAFNYFEDTLGYTITQLGFYWDKEFGPGKDGASRKAPSDNFSTYKKAKKLYIELGLSEEQAQEAAAWETWTGSEVAKRHNFTSVAVNSDNGVVSGFFSR